MASDYYSRISARFWIDTKGWGERNQNVALYLLTNTHRTMEGLYHLPLGYLCADLSLSPKQATAALEVIERHGLVSYDDEAEVVFICKALKHGAPKTPNHVIGAMRRLKAVPRCALWDAFFMACECHASALADAMRVEWPNAFASSVLSTQYSCNPPNPPRGESDEPFPSRPSGNRKRDVDDHKAAVDDWAARHFPDAVSVNAVVGAVSWLATRNGITEVTPDALRQFAATSDTWAEPLGLSSKEAA